MPSLAHLCDVTVLITNSYAIDLAGAGPVSCTERISSGRQGNLRYSNCSRGPDTGCSLLPMSSQPAEAGTGNSCRLSESFAGFAGGADCASRCGCIDFDPVLLAWCAGATMAGAAGSSRFGQFVCGS